MQTGRSEATVKKKVEGITGAMGISTTQANGGAWSGGSQIQAYANGGIFEASTNSDYIAYMREAICDAEGDFSFGSVANGEYYVILSVTWVVGNGHQGGVLAKKISVKNGKDVRALLTY